MNDRAAINVCQITKQYRPRPVLNQLSLTVPAGSVFGLLGKNGAGKTTLIKSILGLLRISSGSITVLGDDPWNFRDETKARLGYVPQTDRVYPWLSVGQLIEYTASFYPSWNRELVTGLVKEWDVNLDEKYGVLSEGQAQKVSIILSLGHEPELLVLDEPVASLDPAARRQFLKTVLDVIANRNCTIFFSTHITSDLERVADCVAVLRNGAIDFSGELGQLKDEVKRLRVTAGRSLPADLEVPGVIYCESVNNESLVSVRGFHRGIKEQIEQQYQAKVTVEDLNLEEIFLEMNR